REAERLLGEAKTIPEVARALEVSENTYHRWQRQFGGMKAGDAKRLKELEREHARGQDALGRGKRDAGVVLAAVAAAAALGPRDLEDLDALKPESPRERDAVGAGALDARASQRAASPAQASSAVLPRRVVGNVSASSRRPRTSTTTAVCVLRCVST